MTKRYGKSAIFAICLLMITLMVGSTVAFLVSKTDAVENKFAPSVVTTAIKETIDGVAKENVQIVNTGDTDAYIRAAIVVTWRNADGAVYGQKPELGTDYTMTIGSGWTLGDDGFYYHNGKVDANNGMTSALIESCTKIRTAPAGYDLSVEIIASGIQTRVGVNNAVEAWKGVN